MLVLTRKPDEQILIGDDIKITLVRVRGNTVRIGIDAPREIRIRRAELDSKAAAEDPGYELSDREQVFAHPEAQIFHERIVVSSDDTPAGNRLASDTIRKATTTPSSMGTLSRVDGAKCGPRPPLSGFMSAT